MNKHTRYYFTLSVIFFLFSCSNNNQTKTDETAEEKGTQTCLYTYDATSTNVHWIAYKHSAKAEVHGNFDSIQVSGTTSGGSPEDVIKEAQITIKTSGTNTSDPERDGKIMKHFFGMMEGNGVISAKIKSIDSEGKAVVSVLMNSVEKEVQMTYTIKDLEIKLTGTILVSEWNGQNALKSINEACEAKHTGTDGVNKIWDEVTISVKTVLKKVCN